MARPGNGFYQWALGILATLLGSLALITYQGIADDVKENSEHRTKTEGARIPQRMRDVEKKVDWLTQAQIVSHNEDSHTRDLMNRIADKVDARPAPAMTDLPPPPPANSEENDQ